VLNTIEANTLTETLLKQAQSQAQELTSRQEDLRSSNEDLAKQASRLAEQNIEVEAKNQEVELAKRLVEEKAEQLAVSSAFKSEFFSNMSHELRTPLNSLLILAGELKANPDQNLTEAQVQCASIIESSGTELLRLLNDVLDLAKVESGTVALELSELPLLKLQDALEREFRHVADQQGLSFSVEFGPDLAPNLATDPGRLHQVLTNLLANAFKFTERGGVVVRVSRPDRGWRPANGNLGGADAVIAFSISDTGIGIAADLQQRIFEAFAQADGTAARQYGGTGLGLSISRELVRLLGGEIALKSTLGHGSTFTVYLPLARNGDAGMATRRVSQAPVVRPSPLPKRITEVKLSGKRVLVVDDDFGNIFAVTTLLERGGLEVISAESGAEAVAVLERTPNVDIVLVDIMMPIMDGYETMRAMRELPWPGHLAIVALTAKTGSGERRRCIEAGASGYIAKPVQNGPDFLLDLGEALAAAAPVGSASQAVR
jgi:signal transduction histidine kinase/ActR/RegA family two-component response regulator